MYVSCVNESEDKVRTKKDFQIIADDLCKQYNLSHIKVELKNTKCGRARKKTNKITIPKFAIGFGKSFSIYYIIHEVCHFITDQNHTDHFKTVETNILKKYNMLPIYSRAYAKTLYDLKGNKLWERNKK